MSYLSSKLPQDLIESKPKKNHNWKYNLENTLKKISGIAAKNWLWVRHKLDRSQEIWGLPRSTSEAGDPLRQKQKGK